MLRNDFKFGTMDGFSTVMGQTYREVFMDEILNRSLYEKFYSVSEGDVVVDVGANVGLFTESIMRKKPSHVYCIEPHPEYFATLSENMKIYPNVTCINIAIGNEVGKVEYDNLDGSRNVSPCTTWERFITDFGIGYVNFLKLDCEGGEYCIIRPDNYLDVFRTVNYIVGEFHMNNNRPGGEYFREYNQRFTDFKNLILNKIKKYKLYSVCGSNLRHYLMLPDHPFEKYFLGHYTEVIIHIDTKSAF